MITKRADSESARRPDRVLCGDGEENIGRGAAGCRSGASEGTAAGPQGIVDAANLAFF